MNDIRFIFAHPTKNLSSTGLEKFTCRLKYWVPRAEGQVENSRWKNMEVFEGKALHFRGGGGGWLFFFFNPVDGCLS